MTTYYIQTIKALQSNEFISVHCMVEDLREQEIWFDEGHAEAEVRRARMGHLKDKIRKEIGDYDEQGNKI